MDARVDTRDAALAAPAVLTPPAIARAATEAQAPSAHTCLCSCCVPGDGSAALVKASLLDYASLPRIDADDVTVLCHHTSLATLGTGCPSPPLVVLSGLCRYDGQDCYFR